MATAKATGPVTEAERQEFVRLHGEGKSLTEIHKQTGRSKDTISRHANDLGLSFDTTQTAAATTSTKDRAAAKRAELELSLLETAGDALDLVGKAMSALGTSGNGPSARDAKDAATALSYLLNGSLKIHAVDAVKDDSTSDVDSWLDSVTGGQQ